MQKHMGPRSVFDLIEEIHLKLSGTDTPQRISISGVVVNIVLRERCQTCHTSDAVHIATCPRRRLLLHEPNDGQRADDGAQLPELRVRMYVHLQRHGVLRQEESRVQNGQRACFFCVKHGGVPRKNGGNHPRECAEVLVSQHGRASLGGRTNKDDMRTTGVCAEDRDQHHGSNHSMGRSARLLVAEQVQSQSRSITQRWKSWSTFTRRVVRALLGIAGSSTEL